MDIMEIDPSGSRNEITGGLSCEVEDVLLRINVAGIPHVLVFLQNSHVFPHTFVAYIFAWPRLWAAKPHRPI